MSREAKAVNLKAVQTLNGLIDTCDELITRCTTGGSGQLPELKARYEVEFMLPSNTSPQKTGGLKIKIRQRREELSLRSVVIEFPSGLREEVRQAALTRSSRNEEAVYTGLRLKKHMEKELMRLLTVAGLEHEGPIDEGEDKMDGSTGGQERKQPEEWTLSDHFLHELGIEPVEDDKSHPTAFFGRRKTKNAPLSGYAAMHEKRQAFTNSIRWDKFRDKYDAAFEDAKADDDTNRMDLYNPNSKDGRERREKLISEICSRVEIWMGVEEHGDVEGADIPEGLDVVAQLVAIRRLSTILLDNFDYLKMEKMGRMWENLVIVFTPPRNGRKRYIVEKKHKTDDAYADVARKHSPHPGRKLNKWERRIKKRERAEPPSRGFMRRVAESHYDTLHKAQMNQDTSDDEIADDSNGEEESTHISSPSQVSESGFKFSYGSQTEQGTGQVTAYIPIDFGGDEVVKQLHIYLYDYFDNCCSHVGFLKMGADGKLSANVAGLDDDEDVGERVVAN
jgi:hypothetical protein